MTKIPEKSLAENTAPSTIKVQVEDTAIYPRLTQVLTTESENVIGNTNSRGSLKNVTKARKEANKGRKVSTETGEAQTTSQSITVDLSTISIIRVGTFNSQDASIRSIKATKERFNTKSQMILTRETKKAIFTRMKKESAPK